MRRNPGFKQVFDKSVRLCDQLTSFRVSQTRTWSRPAASISTLKQLA